MVCVRAPCIFQALALSALPPTHIFGLLKQLCLSILQVACTCAAEIKQVNLSMKRVATLVQCFPTYLKKRGTKDASGRSFPRASCRAARSQLNAGAFSRIVLGLINSCLFGQFTLCSNSLTPLDTFRLAWFCSQLVLVVIEDLQWVDSSTLDMILAFLEAGQQEPWEGGCMFLLSTRPASTFPRHLLNTRDKIVNQRLVLCALVAPGQRWTDATPWTTSSIVSFLPSTRSGEHVAGCCQSRGLFASRKTRTYSRLRFSLTLCLFCSVVFFRTGVSLSTVRSVKIYTDLGGRVGPVRERH